MHTQHVKFSTYVLGGGGVGGVADVVADSLPSLSFFFFGGTGDEPAAAAVVVAAVAAIVVVALLWIVLLRPQVRWSPTSSGTSACGPRPQLRRARAALLIFLVSYITLAHPTWTKRPLAPPPPAGSHPYAVHRLLTISKSRLRLG